MIYNRNSKIETKHNKVQNKLKIVSIQSALTNKKKKIEKELYEANTVENF